MFSKLLLLVLSTLALSLGSAEPKNEYLRGPNGLPASDENGIFGMLPGVLPPMVDEANNQVEYAKEIVPPYLGGSGGIGPAWTYDDNIEAPAGLKDMGSWVKAVYTEEQQARLGVREDGTKLVDDFLPEAKELLAKEEEMRL
eukprot:g2372.t1